MKNEKNDLKEANADLKSVLLGKMGQGLAADFNDIMENILINCDNLLRRLPKEGGGLVDQVLGIRKSCEHGTALLRQVMSFGPHKLSSPTAFYINSVLIEMERILHQIAGENIKIIFNLSQDLRPVCLSVSDFEETLMNFIYRAKQAMPNGGEIHLETLNQGPHVQFSLRKVPFLNEEGNYPQAPSGTPDLFDPGPFIEELNLNGGKFIEETTGQSSTLCKIYFPVVSMSGKQLPKGPASQEGIRHSKTKGTILLAEDQDNLRLLLKEILEDYGYMVLTASDIYEVLTIFNQKKNHINLLLTDVVMPGMTGPELVKYIRGHREDLKVIFISGFPETVDRSFGHGELGKKSKLEKDDFYFLQKPFSMEDLLEWVDHLTNNPPPQPTV